MSKERIDSSPLRRKMTIGATQPETGAQNPATPEQPETEKHNSIQTSKHTDIKATPVSKVRTTIYIPEELAVRLKIYVARHRGEDASKIIARLLEEFLDGEEQRQ